MVKPSFWEDTRKAQALVQERAEVARTLGTLQDLARQAEEDSVRRVAASDFERLRQQLDSARTSAAPVAVLDSLRQQLAASSRRTEALEGALKRAQEQMADQLSAGDSIRKATQAELTRVVGVEQPSMVATLRRMEAADLVRRDPDPDDRRRAIVTLTPKAQAIRADVQGLRREIAAEALADFSTEECASVLGMLNRLDANLEELTG